jgi:hypothetical protein
MSNPISSRYFRGSLRYLAILVAGFTLATMTSVAANPPSSLKPALSPNPPQDIPLPASADEVNNFAWKLFVALNWPELPGKKGIPDESKHIGDAGPTVWRSFKTSGELFKPTGQDPGPWNFGEPNPLMHLDQSAKATKRELELSEVKQAIGGPLTDQHGNLTYYEKASNVISYDFIRQNKLYNKEGQSQFGPVVFPFGSVEVKAAWRIMTADDNQSRYYTMPAVVLENGVEKSVTVGLAGLHIITKTPNAPQWIWSTFEQVDNVPGDSPIGAAPWSYNNPASATPPNTETKPGTPTQVERYKKDLPEAINTRWQQALAGTPWQYYQLIGAQYPIKNPEPDQLANVVMETYIQPQSSCIDCHSTAKSLTKENTDFSFLLLDAASAKPASR